MHATKTDGRRWCIRTEFTMLPYKVTDKNCLTNTTQGKSGLCSSYCCKLNCTANTRTTHNDFYKPIEYQKGSLTFTSIPPCRLHTTACGSNFEYHDSGYGSDLLSLKSLTSGALLTPNNQNNRKCRSTCNIVLCSNVCDSEQVMSANPCQGECEKINNLYCQTPTLQSKRYNAKTECDDHYCQHTNSVESRKLIPGEQIFSEEGSQCSTTNSSIQFHHVSDSMDYKPYKRDVSIQTSDSLQKCSVTSLENRKKIKQKRFKRTIHNFGKRDQYSASTRDSGERLQTSSSGTQNLVNTWDTINHARDLSKRSRTIHIDVYCTDTEVELSETSSDSWENESCSTPQTVLESQNVCVTHERAGDKGLPFKLKRHPRKETSTTSVEINDSDIDGGSSISYPSKINSYSTINDFSSSISSTKSWKSLSLLSYENDCNSVKKVSRMGALPIIGTPILHKTNSIERKSVAHDMGTIFFLGQCNSHKSNKPTVENKAPNIYLGQSTSQNNDKYAVECQNLYEKIPFFNKNLNNDNNKDKINKSKRNYIENEDILFSDRSVYDSNTSRPMIEVLPAQYTEKIASRFGQVINIFKKHGRHKGPTKNPDCGCDHCRRYFM